MLEDQVPSEDENLPTLASLSPSSRFRPPTPEDKPTAPITPSSSSPPSIDPKAPEPVSAADPQSPEELEAEASQQGAFNEETGEINWDCPCLGGMAHGPCGEEFRAAFSCFVYSQEDPKGMDCIENFKTMQGCFRQHPDIYGEELDDEDEEAQALGSGEEAAVTAASLPEDTPATAAAEGILAKQKAAAPEVTAAAPSATTRLPQQEKKSIYDSEDERRSELSPKTQNSKEHDSLPKEASQSKHTPSTDAKLTEDDVVPKAAHDATTGKKD